jgi:maleate isomerase
VGWAPDAVKTESKNSVRLKAFLESKTYDDIEKTRKFRKESAVYGWRGKVGLITPSINCAMEPEFNKMVPNGVAVYATRILLEKGLPEELEKMAGGAEQAAALLKTANVTGIIYGCTSGSVIKGVSWDHEIIREIESRAGVPAITPSTAAIEAFHELKISSVAVATPYIDVVNRIEKEFFEDSGVKVINIQGLQYTNGEELQREAPETAYFLARKVDRKEAECIFISCTAFRTIEVINLLEQDLGKPVMSSNTVSLWGILKRIGVKERIEGFGEILRHL